MSPAIRAAINRANAQKSTGPKTLDGKDRARMNAMQHGLTAQRMIMQPHELAEYRRMSEAFAADLRPATEAERQLVQKIIDTHMRLNRISAIENNILNLSLVENLTDAVHDDQTEAMLAQSRAWLGNEKTFENMSRYRSRATRELLQCSKDLDRIQDARRARETELARQAQQAPAAVVAPAAAATAAALVRHALTQTADSEPDSPELASFGTAALEPVPASTSSEFQTAA